MSRACCPVHVGDTWDRAPYRACGKAAEYEVRFHTAPSVTWCKRHAEEAKREGADVPELDEEVES